MFSLHVSRSLCHAGDHGKSIVSFQAYKYALLILKCHWPLLVLRWVGLRCSLGWLLGQQHQPGSLALSWLQESSHHIWFFLETSQQLLSRNQPAASAYLVSLQNYQLFQLGLVCVASRNRLSFPGNSFSHLVWRGMFGCFFFFSWKGEN